MTFDVPILGYRGPDAEALAERWNGPDRPFVVSPWETVRSTSESGGRTVDCAVVESDAGRDVSEWIDEIHDRIGSIPVIIVNVGPVAAIDAALPDGATSQITVPADVDRIELLSELEPLVEELITCRRERSILDSLFANVPLSMYVKDRTGRHVAVSDAMIDMIGPPYIENPEGKRHHHPADIVGKTDFDLYSADLAVESTDDDQSVVETGQPVENRVEESYGEYGVGTNVVSSKLPWYGPDGNIRGTVGVTRDISERKQYEHQLERQNERLRRLATMVSHDIRNPLSVAMGRLEVARETGEDAQFDAVEDALDRIDALVADIITVMRQGEPPTDLDPVALSDVVRDVWAGIPSAGATLQVATEATIYVDPGRLRLLLNHLFANAVEHGRDGADAITVTVGTLPDENGFFVADDGVGIPADQHDRVLEPGLSGSDTSTLGLPLVATIADAHNWTTRVTESDEGGARFEFHGVRHFDA